ncbi:glycosyltransferase [Lactobacillus delbrueckii subsp. lactis]|uniref:Glycosyltransferase n=1 Tax=Lactobacillus delbrueckii TaxID=1584 RepID=A0ABD4W362_9LACO|nr:glycosyltransferase [Lactobacillus delbrueckii]ADQ61863.1 Glycosyl transferase, group 1 [Lactobacillus delbrueckii subsp. bulgaricus ND02]MBO3082547.1 glycosyltransferase [Lactobacillus delbrueckii subsp. bulgaricus]MCD5438776.1 glycosyltransferase [Lactobacillus delbrueckii subsp. lactis]MCD5469347.1 glycosyltransferase [Lactobacillus delbrueckii subsp. lactis]MCZ0796520.1 glycosyltransferase [Lactobacillus delbrueckii subsp. lactis]
MKIIEYTLGLPPYRRGGLPRYSTDLSTELAKNNKVYLLYPGQINPFSKKIVLKKKKVKYAFSVIEMQNPLPVSLGLGTIDEEKYMEERDITALKRFVEKVNPDVVHFHTFMGVPKVFFDYLNQAKIRVVYTTHDFYGLCPKMLATSPKELLRSSRCSYDCMLCNIGPSFKKIVIMQSHAYEHLKDSTVVKKLRSNGKVKVSLLDEESDPEVLDKKEIEKRYRLRKYYLEMYQKIDFFHFNSSVSEKYVKKFIPTAKGQVIPITHSGLSDNRNKSEYLPNTPVRLGYVGPYDKKKGFFVYTRVLQRLEKTDNFRAEFYGDVVERPVFVDKHFVNRGVVPSEKLTGAYGNFDILIVPSLWHETFGFVVLEALLQGTPCLVSKNVGSQDLVPSEWVFDDEDELGEKLSYLLANPKKIVPMHEEVRKLRLEFSMENHADTIERVVY